MQFIKITTILLLIAVGAHASDIPHNPSCFDYDNCGRKALRHVGLVNARRANEIANGAATPEIAG